jgi:hypothetical protein
LEKQRDQKDAERERVAVKAQSDYSTEHFSPT